MFTCVQYLIIIFYLIYNVVGNFDHYKICRNIIVANMLAGEGEEEEKRLQHTDGSPVKSQHAV